MCRGSTRHALTSDRYEWSCDNDFLAEFVLQPLSKDVHVKTAVEAEAEALTKERRALPI